MHTKEVIEYLKLNETDRVSVPSRYDEDSVLAKILPDEVFKTLVDHFGGERLRPVGLVESDLINIREKMIKYLSNQFTEDEIAFCLGLKPRTIRYLYKFRTDECNNLSNHIPSYYQRDLFE